MLDGGLMFRKKSTVVDSLPTVAVSSRSSHWEEALLPKVDQRDRMADFGQQVREWLSKVSYPGTAFPILEWSNSPLGVHIQILIDRPAGDSFGKVQWDPAKGEVYQSKGDTWFYGDARRTEDAFFERLFKTVAFSEIHEAQEWFKVDGACWRNPHVVGPLVDIPDMPMRGFEK